MNAQRKVKELESLSGGGERVAAFFDLDGTLVPQPSMEKRFIAALRYQQLIGVQNYFWWTVEAARLAPRGINQVLHANKMYLQGVPVAQNDADIPVRLFLPTESKKSAERTVQPGSPVPLYRQAIERVVWHAKRQHLIVVVSGSLAFLAETATRALEYELEARGLPRGILVCATRLEEKDARWTGRILGQAMFGEAKAQALERIAAEANLDLRRCFAYGDSAADRWMLEAVGKPAAVNPSNDLARIARRNNWIVLRWQEEKDLTRRARIAPRVQQSDELGSELHASRAKSEYGA